MPPSAAILEVGCGDGRVALELLRRGHTVTGLDSDRNTVEGAVRRGAPVVHASWPDYEGPVVDAVVFTRSLHNISPLQAAVRRAREMLRPSGVLLVEDFAFEAADRPTIEWLRRIHDSARGRGLLETDLGWLTAPDPFEEWRAHHQLHEVETSRALSDSIEREFTIASAGLAPYLFRYIIPVLSGSTRAVEFLEEVLEEETRLGVAGAVSLIGRRFVGRPRPTLG